MPKRIIAIDPGANGGIAVKSDSGIEAYNMPATFPDIYNLLKELSQWYGPTESEVTAVLEDVGHGLPGQSSSATAKFARHCGHLEMALYALGVKTCMVTPQKWQKFYSNSLGKSSSCTKNEWKNKLKGLAQQMFPSLKVTLCTADALLLAEYGWRNEL